LYYLLSRVQKNRQIFINNIFIVRQIVITAAPPLCYVQYNDSTKKITVEVEGEQLSVFLKAVTMKTGRNVIPAYDAAQVKVSSFILAMPFEEAIDKIAYSNNLVSRPTPDGFILIEKKPVEKPEAQTQPQPQSQSQSQSQRSGNTSSSGKNDRNTANSVINVRYLGTDSIQVLAENAQLADVVKEVAFRCGRSYILAAEGKNIVNVQITGSSFSDILSSLLIGSGLVLKESGDLYIIGSKDTQEMMTQSIVRLQYRSVDSLIYLIPKDIIDLVEVRAFGELNSLLLSGPQQKVAIAEDFIKQIDRIVPVISIEVLIIDYNTSYTINTGITAGIGEQPVAATTGTVFPAVDVNLNSQSVNDIINRFNGFGWAKIGMVTPNFYASLKMLESQGILKIRSTPILSTLNGHQAELSIGKTEYYMEEQVNIIGTQNPQQTVSKIYKPLTAEMAVKITPQVSGDNQITLEVEVIQSDFTERISTTAPPGQVSRTFKSQIRVKNGEMILLGGLEEKRDNKTSNGAPFLSRIPVLKWFFSSRNEEKSDSKLNIFIKPSIIN